MPDETDQTKHPDKYDHSDHPTTRKKAGDLEPPSDAKRDDQVDERAGQRHTPGDTDVAESAISPIRRVDADRPTTHV